MQPTNDRFCRPLGTGLGGMALVVSCCLGCSVKPETLQRLRDAVESASAVPNQTESTSVTTVSAQPASFQPPYPDRTDPFTFPNEFDAADDSDANVGQATELLRTNAAHSSQIQVLGFADVGQPRVLVRSHEQTRLLSEGDTIHGITVVAIRPPVVELKAGLRTWTASMFDDVITDP